MWNHFFNHSQDTVIESKQITEAIYFLTFKFYDHASNT